MHIPPWYRFRVEAEVLYAPCYISRNEPGSNHSQIARYDLDGILNQVVRQASESLLSANARLNGCRGVQALLLASVEKHRRNAWRGGGFQPRPIFR